MRLKINKKNIKILSVLLVIVLIIAAIFGLLSVLESKIDSNKTQTLYEYDDDRIFYNDSWYLPNDDLNTILVMGLDKYDNQRSDESYNNNQQADFLMLLIVDKDNKSYTALHINRDTMAKIQVLGVKGDKAGTIDGQLALAYTYGSGRKDSCHNTVYTVSNYLYGIDIDHYVSITMDAVSQINDLVGGVTLTMPDDLSGVDPSMTKGATVTLKGDMALGFVRARGGLEDSSNIKRMERQRIYLKALKDKIAESVESNEAFIADAIKKTSQYMISDLTANQLSKLYEDLVSYSSGDILTIEGTATVGEEFMEFYADEAKLKEQIIELFYIPVEE